MSTRHKKYLDNPMSKFNALDEEKFESGERCAAKAEALVADAIKMLTLASGVDQNFGLDIALDTAIALLQQAMDSRIAARAFYKEARISK